MTRDSVKESETALTEIIIIIISQIRHYSLCSDLNAGACSNEMMSEETNIDSCKILSIWFYRI